MKFTTILKKKRSKLFLSVLAIFGILCFLYHNDTAYNKILKEKINTRTIAYFGTDVLAISNDIAHLLDFKGKIKTIINPLDKSDYINITISPESLSKLNEGLQKVPRKKKWVKINFNISEGNFNAKLKFHGTSIRHYQNDKFSYTIKLQKDSNHLNESRRFKLIKAEEYDPLAIVPNKVAKTMGLISSYGEMKILRINGVEKGHYYFVEDIRKELLEREYGITNYTILGNIHDLTRKENVAYEDPHISDNDLYFGHIETTKSLFFGKALEQYKILTKEIDAGNIEVVKKSFDIEYISKFLALAAVFNDVHFMSGHNVKILYDFGRGKFYPIYRIETGGHDIPIKYKKFPLFNEILFKSHPKSSPKSVNVTLFKLLLTDNEIRNKRDMYINDFFNNKNSFIEGVKEVYQVNEHIMLYAQKSRRTYDQLKNKQIARVIETLTLGKKYIDYASIFLTYDSTSNELNLLADVFSPINISYKKYDFHKENINGIEFNKDLQWVYKYKKFDIDYDNFNPKKLIFINNLTKDTISKKRIYINYIENSSPYIKKSTEEMLNENQINYSLVNNHLTILSGNYIIKSDVIISPKFNTHIQKNVTFRVDNDINLCVLGNITIDGLKNKEVVIKNLDPNGNFGSFAILGQDSSSYANINFLKVSGGKSSYFMKRHFTSQFSIFNSNVTLKNSIFENSMGDDGLNIKYSKVSIDSSKFINNLADQIDLDFCFATISNCTFTPSLIDSNGDGLDLSGSYSKITNCIFSGFLDKGLSIGEKSKTLLSNCSFNKNVVAIAIKDQTTLYSWRNSFNSNKIDYSVFVKKKIFKIPTLYINEKSTNLKINLVAGNKFNLEESRIKIEEEQFITMYENYKGSSLLSNTLYLNQLVSDN